MDNIALLSMFFYTLYAYLAIMTLFLGSLPEPLREDGVGSTFTWPFSFSS